MKTCPSCGHENSNDARFCSQCAFALDAPASAQEERKVVTVLFADLVGFTARAEKLDPEDVRTMLRSYHDRVRAELERHGGTVERYLGDGVMALFGAPVAHEDDPERAVRAAFAIRDGFAELNRVDPAGKLHVRIGVNTGEALVTLAAGPGATETTTAGDVVNTAARLEAAAPVDGILVGEATFRATQRAISYRERAPVEAKGKSEPVGAWEALEPRARFGLEVRQISRSPLVGRARELDTLVEALARVREERTPLLVTLAGVPGIGKSRLVWELFKHADADPDLITWRQGRSLPYGDGVTFWALGEMVKAQAGILETDSSDEAQAKLHEAVVVVGEEDRDRVERRLKPLVGLEEDEEVSDRRDETFAAWRLWLEALAEQRPLVLVFEDLHWADDQLLDFVDYLAEWVSGVPMLVVGTARPELLSRRPEWGGGKPNATTLTLSPLSDDETAHLVHALLERSVLPADLQSTLLERAGGNPLYAEEFVRMVGQHAGLEELSLPESVHSLITARIDTLPPDEKALLQDAAVVGKVFWVGALAALRPGDRLGHEERLHALERKEFIRRERRSTVAGENEYAFRHVLVRDAAYGQIPRGVRAEKHRHAAAWLESLGRPEDHAEMTAHHYVNALELARAAGLDTHRLAAAAGARHALRLAGDRAAGLNAFPAAVRFYREALRLWPADDPERPQLLFRLGYAVSFAEGGGEDELTQAVEGFLAAGDRETAAEAEAVLGEIAWHRADRDAMNRHIERAAELVADVTSSPSKARVLGAVTRSYMLAGRRKEALEFGEKTLALAESLGLDEVRAQALSYTGGAQVRLGDATGLERSHHAVEIARAINSPQLTRWLNNYASQLFEEGEVARAFACWEEAEEVARRDGALALGRFVNAFRTLTLFERGRWDEALERANAFIEAADTMWHYEDSICREVRGLLRLARGDLTDAKTDSDRGLEIARRAGDPQIVFPQLVFHAMLLAELGDLENASADADEFLEIGELASIDSSFIFLAQLFEALDRVDDLARLRNRANATRWRDAVDLHLAGDPGGAADLCGEIGLLAGAARWRLLAGRLLVAGGRQAEADVQLEKALAFFRPVCASRYVREAELLRSATA
jgi:class 3 adenylate cyclase/tetratricopeptide (TPR) repeat protein